MQRSTTPDAYSEYVRQITHDWRNGKLSSPAFYMLISLVWRLRGNA